MLKHATKSYTNTLATIYKHPSAMKKLLLCALTILAFSCSSSDEAEILENQDTLDSYLLYYMNYPKETNPVDLTKLVTITKNNEGIITERIGGVYDANLDPAVGFKYFFSEKIYDELTYQDNTIIIEKKSMDSDLVIPTCKRTLIFDENQKIIQKTIETSAPDKTDTIDFQYNVNGKISKILYKGPNIPKETSFYFNNNENLDSIVTIEYELESDKTIKTLERFENYDSAENPIKELFIFEELFYRSLSRNNYSLHWFEVFITTPSSSSFSSTYREWDLKYDANGKVIFDE